MLRAPVEAGQHMHRRKLKHSNRSRRAPVEAGAAQPVGATSEDQLMTRLRKGGPGTMKLTTKVNAASLFLQGTKQEQLRA